MSHQLHPTEPLEDAEPKELAKVVLSRFGLLPRKKDAQAKMHRLLLELYERKKQANKEKKPELAVLRVEDMAVFAGIKRQTMYDYLGRWLALNVLKKTSFVNEGTVVIGYELNGANLEGAFQKAATTIRNHTDLSLEYIRQLQNEIKREKLRSKPKEADD